MVLSLAQTNEYHLELSLNYTTDVAISSIFSLLSDNPHSVVQCHAEGQHCSAETQLLHHADC